MSGTLLMNEDALTRHAINSAFPGIPESEVEKLRNVGQVKTYSPETSLCLEGNVEDIFYILLTGEVIVTKEINSSDNRLLKRLYPGDFFGEMGLIHDAPRAATVTTKSEVTVLEIDKIGFNDVLQESSTVSLAMVREVSRRLRENDEMAIEDLRLKAGELAEAYQQLAEIELIRREFLTTIAHELRTPLTSANGFLQMIKMGILEGNDLQNALDSVSKNLLRIIDLTNDILFVQEMDLIFSDFEPIDLNLLINTIVEEEFDHSKSMGVSLHYQGDDDSAKIMGDKKSIKRAFRALINNAVKFSLNGGVVGINIALNQDIVEVSIKDEGIGISDLDLPHIFDRFWRTEAHDGYLFDGIGLGLSIAKQVINQHKGKIKVNSKYGEGTEFKVELPVYDEVNQSGKS